MIAKVTLLFAAFAAAHSTLIGTGLSPGLINAGLISPLSAGIPITTRQIIGIPGAMTLNKGIIGAPSIIGTPRMIGGPGLIGAPGIIGAPLLSRGMIGGPGLIGAPGIIGAPLLSKGMIGNGLIGNSPLTLSRGIISPIGLGGVKVY